MEKCGKFRKNGRFSGRIWPDWGNTTWADMAGLGSIGLKGPVTGRGGGGGVQNGRGTSEVLPLQKGDAKSCHPLKGRGAKSCHPVSLPIIND